MAPQLPIDGAMLSRVRRSCDASAFNVSERLATRAVLGGIAGQQGLA